MSETLHLERNIYFVPAKHPVCVLGLPYKALLHCAEDVQIPFVTGFSNEENGTSKLIQTSPSHARSFVEREYPHIEYDEYGNPFGGENIKGNESSFPYLIKGPSARGFIVLGLQDDFAIDRIIVGSNYLRSRGIWTEIPDVYVPEFFPVEGKLLSLSELRKLLLDRCIQSITSPVLEVTALLGGVDCTREDISAVETFLSEVVFVVTRRKYQVNERIWDFIFANSYADIIKLLTPSFNFINGINEASGLSERYNIENPADILLYLQEKLAQLLAINLAKMHKAGITHNNLHGANVSSVGSIFDLDTLSAAILGDEPITIQAVKNDLQMILHDIERVFTYLADDKGFFPEISSKTIFKNFKNTFFTLYMKEYGNGGIADIAFALMLFASESNTKEIIYRLVLNELGVGKAPFSVDVTDLVRDFYTYFDKWKKEHKEIFLTKLDNFGKYKFTLELIDILLRDFVRLHVQEIMKASPELQNTLKVVAERHGNLTSESVQSALEDYTVDISIDDVSSILNYSRTKRSLASLQVELINQFGDKES